MLGETRLFGIGTGRIMDFIAPESRQAGYKKPVGRFPFDTRKQESEESYGGFNQLSWQNSNFISQMRARDLVRALTWSYRRLGI
jgi:hypothetical protein